MWLTLQTDDLLMVGKVKLILADKANYDSQSSHCSGSQGINFCLSLMPPITPGKSLNEAYDVLIYLTADVLPLFNSEGYKDGNVR